MIESKEIKISAKQMLTVLFCNYGTPWTIAALMGIIVFIILGFCLDFRFFFLALIWLFLIVPLVVAFLYFYYGMKPLTAFNTIPHKIFYDNSEIRIRILPKDEAQNDASEETIERGEGELGEKKLVSENEDELEKKDFVVNMDSFNRIISGSDYVVVFSNENGFMWIPIAGFDTMKQFSELTESISNNIKK